MRALLNGGKVSIILLAITIFIGACGWGLAKVYEFPSTYVTKEEYARTLKDISIILKSDWQKTFVSKEEFERFDDKNEAARDKLYKEIKSINSEVMELNRFLRNTANK
jgi:Na+-translocating ferredoxin:NAD+ oxidoreductase RnfG subunit